jgi:putative DNA primase/helicase
VTTAGVKDAPLNLSDTDLKRLVGFFRIPESLLRLHQIRRVTSQEARVDCGIHYHGDLSGVDFPIWGADGTIKGHRVRRDNPEIEKGKPKAKYVQSDDRPHLFFERSSRAHLEDPNVPVIFVEAASSALAVAAWSERTGRKVLVIATHGCANWQGTIATVINENGVRVPEKGPLPDLDLIPFKKREVFILFDSNISINGNVKSQARKLTRVLQEKGATVRIPVIPEECGNGPDDYLACRSDEDFAALLDGAAMKPVYEWPFRLRDNSVLGRIETEDKETGKKTIEWRPICSYLEVDSETRDIHGENWGRILIVKDRDGRSHKWAMPMSLIAGDGVAYREHLLFLGLEIEPGKWAKDQLHQYITTACPDRRSRCVTRIGWHRSSDSLVYVLPDETFGSSRERVIVQSSWASQHPYQVLGSLEDWQNHVAKYCVGNSRLAFAVSLAFAPPLMDAINEAGGGVHFRGQSSTGKTTVLGVAGSVWGGGINGFIRNWRATSNGLEAVAESHNDALLCLDEISQVDSKEVGETAYMLANGHGKSRAQKDGSSRQAAQWRLLFLSTGEVGLADKMNETGRKMKAGQEVRLVDIEADAGAGLGIFENLHGFQTPSAFANALRASSLTYYGSPIREFLRHIKPENLTGAIEKYRLDFIKEHVPADASGQVYRVAERFALIAYAGSLATALGILPWSEKEALNAAIACFKNWLQARGTIGNQESITAIRQVKKFFENHGNSRFQDWDSPNATTINRAGFKRCDAVTGATDFYVLTEVFRSEICNGLDPKFVSGELVKHGCLVPANDGRLDTLHRLPGLEKASRVYHFNSSILEDTTSA